MLFCCATNNAGPFWPRYKYLHIIFFEFDHNFQTKREFTKMIDNKVSVNSNLLTLIPKILLRLTVCNPVSNVKCDISNIVLEDNYG